MGRGCPHLRAITAQCRPRSVRRTGCGASATRAQRCSHCATITRHSVRQPRIWRCLRFYWDSRLTSLEGYDTHVTCLRPRPRFGPQGEGRIVALVTEITDRNDSSNRVALSTIKPKPPTIGTRGTRAFGPCLFQCEM